MTDDISKQKQESESFDRLMRGLILVSKDELDAEEKKYKKAQRKQKNGDSVFKNKDS
ncbi:hypothetical protein HED60_08260 [Planctomycetales bacterium ZRK34]|nr:hypothetical protein HED60_08260 [Planctomycetales bacterium ZRK34]